MQPFLFFELAFEGFWAREEGKCHPEGVAIDLVTSKVQAVVMLLSHSTQTLGTVSKSRVPLLVHAPATSKYLLATLADIFTNVKPLLEEM